MQGALFPELVGKPLTVLSFGAGQDSTAILYKLLYDPEFREKYAPGDLVIVFADTHNEHPSTYKHIVKIKALCAEHGVEFIVLTGREGYHSPNWSKGLINFYNVTRSVGSKAFRKTCTIQLKINPIYKWLDKYVYEKYSLSVKGNKRSLRQFALGHGKIKVLIGIAHDEETRISLEDKDRWMRDSVHKIYPLVDLGWDRQDCQDYIVSLGKEIPLPSNCILCPFMSLQELLYLYRSMPDWYDTWVEIEEQKLLKFSYNGDITKTMNRKGQVVDNLGVWGKKPLPEMLKEAEERFGHLSIEQLHEYRMSHGHCVKSKF